jgi:hypothetical protein
MRRFVLVAAATAIVAAGATASEKLFRVGKIGKAVYRDGKVQPVGGAERFGMILWDASRNTGWYGIGHERERLDWGNLTVPGRSAPVTVDGFEYAYATNQRCDLVPGGDPNNDCLSQFLAFYDNENGFNDPNSNPVIVIEVTGTPGADPNLPVNTGSGWIIGVDLEGDPNLEFDLADEDFGYGYFCPVPVATQNAGPFMSRPGSDPAFQVLARDIPTGGIGLFHMYGASVGDPNDLANATSAPGAQDVYDRYNDNPGSTNPGIPGKWDGDTYAGSFFFGGFNPDHPDPNDPNYIMFTQFWMGIFGSAGGAPDCDVNGDGVVGNEELQCVLDFWQDPEPGGACANMAGWDGGANSNVGNEDLQFVLDNWQDPCP